MSKEPELFEHRPLLSHRQTKRTWPESEAPDTQQQTRRVRIRVKRSKAAEFRAQVRATIQAFDPRWSETKAAGEGGITSLDESKEKTGARSRDIVSFEDFDGKGPVL